MNEEKLKEVLDRFKRGEFSLEETLTRLKNLPFEDLGFAKIDHHREIRKGAPETVYSPGKTTDQLKEIIDQMEGNSNVLITRLNEEKMNYLQETYPEALIDREARVFYLGEFPESTTGEIAIATGGTGDIPVAKESKLTVKSMGVKAKTYFDVGVSGVHRLLGIREEIENADLAVVIAGMEGALPSVVAGLVETPVVAVPTSTGYGANFEGVSPLLTMLNSCAPGVVVVNIDDGYSAGYFGAVTVKSMKEEK
uniref:1-(5-phosphoribosyl)-5-amino-4-imidazole-carboxylate (AIR) carboxylase n=1 Tax=uncultured organism TaxID=155900 RepID=M1PP03_9ZZZZ|nr:1-(5-phosphoribosyl)-5-amino-4-imidazole-carboxylate (AIR) carboxylase [uncultured organism]